MEPKKQLKARKADTVRDTTLSIRTTKRIKALAEIAAYEQGTTLSNYIEQLLLANFDQVLVERVEEDREANPGEDGPYHPIVYTGGRPLSIAADDLYDDDDATCLFKRLLKSKYLSHEQIRLVRLLQMSRILYPKSGQYNAEAIRQHWDVLNQVAEGKASPDLLPSELFGDADIAFALMSEAEQISLYRKNAEEFTRRSQAYLKKTKRSVK
jgi:hypothetical protein